MLPRPTLLPNRREFNLDDETWDSCDGSVPEATVDERHTEDGVLGDFTRAVREWAQECGVEWREFLAYCVILAREPN